VAVYLDICHLRLPN